MKVLVLYDYPPSPGGSACGSPGYRKVFDDPHERSSVAEKTGKSDREWQANGTGLQTCSAELYLYAVKCVEEKRTPFFNEIRGS